MRNLLARWPTLDRLCCRVGWHRWGVIEPEPPQLIGCPSCTGYRPRPFKQEEIDEAREWARGVLEVFDEMDKQPRERGEGRG